MSRSALRDPRHVCPECHVYDPSALFHVSDCPWHLPATAWRVQWPGGGWMARRATPALVADVWRRRAPDVR